MCRELLGNGEDVDALAGVDRHGRVEDDDADLAPNDQVARMLGLRAGDPVVLAVVVRGEVDRRRPGLPAAVGGRDHHVQAAIDDLGGDLDWISVLGHARRILSNSRTKGRVGA